jgi:thiamine biosynthesis lipoprotein
VAADAVATLPPARTEFRGQLWGSELHLLVTDPDALQAATVTVEQLLERVDQAASRFRPDSELNLLSEQAGPRVQVSPLLCDLIRAALDAAASTDGAVDPTVGNALVQLGYDRDLAALLPTGGPVGATTPAPGWRSVQLDVERRVLRLPVGTQLDLGATGKARAVDLAARAAAERTRAGVLLNVGGDIAVAGPVPPSGWVVRVTDDHRHADGPGQNVLLRSGGLATSSTTVRTWRRADRQLHHIVDPRTGAPAVSRWRTVSVAANTCLDANTATTAAILFDADAPGWLQRHRLPARLVDRSGSVVTVGCWPVADPR